MLTDETTTKGVACRQPDPERFRLACSVQRSGIMKTRTNHENPEATEYQRRRNIPGVSVRYMHTGRCSDTVLSLMGREIGTKTEISTRGKVSSVLFYLPTFDG